VSHIDVGDRRLELNEEGFLLHPEQWDDDVARALARAEEQIEDLSSEHWAIVRYIRSYYEEKQLAPMIRLLCKASGSSLKRVYELFPSGPAKGACKVAGLPKPDGCV
jgi:dissimilatory sulfite reductase related protein